MSTKNEQHNQLQSPWTTWEDLLLSSAVKRYGLSDWSTVAMELQSRASIHTQFTAQICQNKFHDLKRRFDVSAAGDTAGDTTVPWLEELKRLRIAELREIVKGRGASIQNLNLKVKRLEEERERSGKEDDNREQKPDLENNKSENEKHDVVRPAKDENEGKVAGDSVSGERSEKENRSVNESNSTDNRPTGEKVEIKTTENEPVQTGSEKINDAKGEPVQADSCNGSSKQSEEKKGENESAKMPDSVDAESKGGTKDSNEAQSSASLTKSQSSNRSGDSGGGGGYEQGASESLAKTTTSRDSVKNSEPLNRFLYSIRSSKYGSVFEVRLQSQNTEKYKSIIRQHVDLETVQNRVANGSYSSCTTKFYLDLLLLFNNAIVFFPKSSPESSAAYELRKLVLKGLAKKRRAKQSKPSLEPAPSTSVKIKSDPEISDPLLAKQKTSVPFIVCRKRSFITSKPSTFKKTQKEDHDKPVVIPKQDDKKQPTTKPTSSNSKEDDTPLLLNLKEKPVTGVRSMRRSSSTRINNTTNTSSKNTTNTSVKTPTTDNDANPESSTIKGSEAPKTENKKKNNQLLLKKREAADFLKRIKKSSPAKGTLLDALKGLPENNSSGSKKEPKEQPKKKVNERKESTAGRQKGSGGSGSGGKRAKEEESSPSKRNVGRPPKRGRDEGATTGKRGKEVVEEVASKRPNKRSKR